MEKTINVFKLSRLTLRNFCGIKTLDMHPLGAGSVSVYGDNATGKTTIANAFAWLLTGKNAAGTAEFDPAPLGGDNAKLHNLETSVEAEFDGGMTLRRTLCEVWTKKRGEVTAQLTGTKTAYYKNDVPLKEKEFATVTEELFGSAELFRVLSSVGYFPAVMDWKARRRMLIDVCGDVNDGDVIAAKSELSELPKLLDGHTVDDYLKVAKARKAALKKELDTIPARITENENAAEGALSDEEITRAEGNLKALEQQAREIDAQIAGHNAPTAADEHKAALRRELEELRGEYLKEHNKLITEHTAATEKIAVERNNVYSERSPLLAKKSTLQDKIATMKNKRESLIAERAEVAAKTYDGGDTCPCCGQKLPPEQIENAVAEFNRRKSEKLSEISERAKATCHKDMISASENELEALSGHISELDEKYNALTEQLEAMRNSAPTNTFTAFEETAEYKRLTAAIAAAESATRAAVPADLTEKRADLAVKISEEKEKLYKAQATKNIRARISELEEQQHTLADEYAACEKGEYLCELFIRTKVSLLDERINSRFHTLKFKLFHEQQNGGLQEICKVLVPCASGLVEYEKANNAARINAGIEIINVLSEHFGIRLPVFVDNAESVTELSHADGQTIRLIVSEADKVLRFEHGK